jgi:hypothetical protein
MAKSDVHARSSVRKFGGKESDYIEIHEMIDSSKAYQADNRHRAIFHHTAGIFYIQKMFGIDFDSVDELRKKYNLPQEFIQDLLQLFKTNRLQGVNVINSDGKKVHVRDIAEQHILEDFRGKFIPSLNDYLSNMSLKAWMNNALMPLSASEDDQNQEKSSKVALRID